MQSTPQTREMPTCDPQRIQLFLQSDHYQIEDADQELIAHLDQCPRCREALETQAANRETWDQAHQLLHPSEFDGASTALYSATSTLGGPGTRSIAIQDVLDALSPTDDPHHLGRIGTHEVTGVVGVGGMGVVLKAIDPALDRVVAIKVMAPRLAHNETARKRFAREAKAAAAVLHPNVIPIHSVSADGTTPHLVMAYIRGGSLQKRLEKDGALPLIEVLRIGAQIAAGLAAAHDQGLVHRDIKPENILLEEGVERVTITDFGLARAVDDNTVTQQGTIAGTPMYMSPEQARGEQLDQKSDLFSLGSVLYALCTGQPPYRADSSYGVMRKIIDESPTPLREQNPAIPEWMVQIVEKLMARDKANRFASAAEVHRFLEAGLSHLQQPATHPIPVVPGVRPRAEQKPFLKTRTGVMTMTALTLAAMLCIAVVSQSGRPSLTVYGPPATEAVAKPASLQPSLIVESHQEEGSAAAGKTAIQRWKMKGQSVGTMTIRVLRIEDGQSRVVSESQFQGGTDGEQNIEVELQLETLDQPMPIAGQAIVPTLAVSVNGLQSQSTDAEEFIFAGELGGHGTTLKGHLGPVHILTNDSQLPRGVENPHTLDAMLRASLRGASFLVTTLEWHSVDAVQSEPPNPGPTAKPSDEDPVIQLLEVELAALRDILNHPERFSPTEPATPEQLGGLRADIQRREAALKELRQELSLAVSSAPKGDSPASETPSDPQQIDEKVSVKLGDDLAIELKRVGDRLVEPTRSKRKEDEAGVVRIQLETTTASPIRPPREGATRPYLSVQNNLDCPLSFRTLVRKAGSDKFFEVDLGMTPVPAGENAYHCWDFDAQEVEVVLFDFQAVVEVQADSQSQLADPNLLQGRWQVVYKEVAGQAKPAREAELIAIELIDTSLIQQRDGQTIEAIYTVDAAQTPVTIEFLPTDGNPVRGILDLRDDTLRLCTVEGTSERPTKFDTQTTTPGVTYLILKRVLSVTAISSRGFSADIEEDFFRRESTSNSNYPDGTLSVEDAQRHLQEDLDLELGSVTSFTEEVASELAKTKKDLWLSALDINDLEPAAIRALVQKQAGTLYMDHCEDLFDEAAVELSQARCAVSLSRVKWLSEQTAAHLSQIAHPLKLGLTRIDDAVAQKLAQHRGWLVLNKLNSIQESQARALAQHASRLSLNGLITITPEIAEALGTYKGEALDLNSLAALDAETARQLSAAQCQQGLSLNGLKAITPEVVTILASGNYSLELQGLTVRDVATRRALDSATVKLRAAGRELVWGAPLEEELLLGEPGEQSDN